MGKRVAWLQFQLRHGRHERLPLVLYILLAFEVYYQLCTLLGYRPRHVLLDPSPESLRAIPHGRRVMMVWPRLPLSIRVLERICPYANGSHAEFAPYTPEALKEVRASGRRAEVIVTVQGELHYGGSFK
jgi:hypothetical protein